MTHQDSPHPSQSRSSEALKAREESPQQDVEGTDTIDMAEALRRIRDGNEEWEKRALASANERKRRALLWSAGILLLLALVAAVYLIL